MRYLSWLLRAVLLVALTLFAVKNTDDVSLHFYFDQVWNAPLILVLFVFFVAGAMAGVLASFTTAFRYRRELGRLRGEMRRRAPPDPATPRPDAATEPPPGI